MQLISVNIGQERAIQYAKESGKTGIYKIPTDQPVQVTPYGLVRDVIVDTENHGGLEQAVYVYGWADYAWWSQELGKELQPGTFGENLTISELESARFSIGDRLSMGEVILEVTSPRIPCVTLSTRMGDPQFIKRFRAAARPGLYCRVITPGFLQVGQAVVVTPYPGETVTALEMFEDFYQPRKDEATLLRYLKSPIHEKARQEKEEMLSKVRAEKG